MPSTLFHRVSRPAWSAGSVAAEMLDAVRFVWSRLDHLLSMNREQLAELGLERMLTTSELAEYLGVKVQAIYHLRADGRGPAGIPIGRETALPHPLVGWPRVRASRVCCPT